MIASDVQILLAAPQAAGGHISPGSIYNSTGRWASTTQVNASVALNNLFPDLTGPQNAAGQVDYQCLFVYNTNATETMANVAATIPTASVLGAVQWALGADNTAASAFNGTQNPQAGFISAPTIAPATVTSFFGPAAPPLVSAPMQNIPPGHVAAVWVRRTAVGSPAFSGAGFSLVIKCDVVT